MRSKIENTFEIFEDKSGSILLLYDYHFLKNEYFMQLLLLAVSMSVF